MSDIAKAMRQTLDFAKGAAWGSGMTIHELGRQYCLSDEDAKELVRRYRKSPAPHQRRPRARKANAVPA